MAAPGKHREAIVRAAAVLFRRQGYAATGTAQILAMSGAPRGSLYHYFPEGKEQIAQAAVEHAGGLVTATLARLVEQQPPGAALREYGRLLAGWLGSSDLQDGCPIATTLLELAPTSDRVSAAGRLAFDAWISVLEQALVASGAQVDQARRLATLAVAAIEGALVLARTRQDGTVVLAAVADVAALFDDAVR